jgi:hypothetical protein
MPLLFVLIYLCLLAAGLAALTGGGSELPGAPENVHQRERARARPITGGAASDRALLS